MTAPLAINTVLAWAMSPLPCQSPPTSTVPPPVAPFANSCEPGFSPMLSASNRMRPPRLTRLVASICPPLMTLARRPLKACALRITSPPGASTAV